jgi:hypothetical protein
LKAALLNSKKLTDNLLNSYEALKQENQALNFAVIGLGCVSVGSLVYILLTIIF